MVIRYEGKVVGDANVHTSPKFLLVCCWGFYTACKATTLTKSKRSLFLRENKFRFILIRVHHGWMQRVRLSSVRKNAVLLKNGAETRVTVVLWHH
ncbi:hypothetical protein QYF36_022887 [Acer negundo]|nr:hypothetical protein QYF36_022887 [Acer negundo]